MYYAHCAVRSLNRELRTQQLFWRETRLTNRAGETRCRRGEIRPAETFYGAVSFQNPFPGRSRCGGTFHSETVPNQGAHNDYGEAVKQKVSRLVGLEGERRKRVMPDGVYRKFSTLVCVFLLMKGRVFFKSLSDLYLKKSTAFRCVYFVGVSQW